MENLGNIVLGAEIVLCVLFAVLRIRKARRGGGCGCGCGGSCGSCGCCCGSRGRKEGKDQ